MQSTVSRGTRTAVLIGGVFGLVYLVVNAGLMAAPFVVAVRVVAIAAFAGLLALLRRGRRGELGELGAAPGGARFGTAYWLVVVGEVACGLAGIVVLNGPLGAPHAVVAWVSLVVGLHFYLLGAVWRLASYVPLATAIAACGAGGLALAAAGASAAAIAATAGLAPGAVLLAASYARLLRGSPPREQRADARERRLATE